MNSSLDSKLWKALNAVIFDLQTKHYGQTCGWINKHLKWRGEILQKNFSRKTAYHRRPESDRESDLLKMIRFSVGNDSRDTSNTLNNYSVNNYSLDSFYWIVFTTFSGCHSVNGPGDPAELNRAYSLKSIQSWLDILSSHRSGQLKNEFAVKNKQPWTSFYSSESNHIASRSEDRLVYLNELCRP